MFGWRIMSQRSNLITKMGEKYEFTPPPVGSHFYTKTAKKKIGKRQPAFAKEEII